MAKKRMTDIEIWDKEWFMDLAPKHKCLIRYLFDSCDAAGVWKPNWKLASLHIGEEVSIKDLAFIPDSQFEMMDGKIFLPDFITFQYGTLSEMSPAHKPVFALIKKHNLSDRVFNRVSKPLQEKDKDKEEEKEKEKDKGGMGGEMIVPQMFTLWRKKKPNYPEDQSKDFRALKNISSFICKQAGLSFQPQEPDVGESIMQSWGIMVDFIVQDDFYNAKSLTSISYNIQSIVSSIQNGKSNPKGKSKPGAKISGTQLNEALTKFRNQGAAPANNSQ